LKKHYSDLTDPSFRTDLKQYILLRRGLEHIQIDFFCPEFAEKGSEYLKQPLLEIVGIISGHVNDFERAVLEFVDYKEAMEVLLVRGGAKK
jgi:hypothetical protein